VLRFTEFPDLDTGNAAAGRQKDWLRSEKGAKSAVDQGGLKLFGRYLIISWTEGVVVDWPVGQ
jgi:hypothetical protein